MCARAVLAVAVLGAEEFGISGRGEEVLRLVRSLERKAWAVESLCFFPEAGQLLCDFLAAHTPRTDCLVLVPGGDPLEVRRTAETLKQKLPLRDAPQDVPAGSNPGVVLSLQGRRLFVMPAEGCENISLFPDKLNQPAPSRECRRLHVVGLTPGEARDRMRNEPALSPFRVSVACGPNLVTLVPEGTEEEREAALALLAPLFPGECLPPGVETLAEAVLGEAVASGRTLAAAESCTGGLIGGALTDIPGASASFLGTAVCYANGAKRKILGVPREVLETDGAVSEACALAMAKGARALYGADLAVSVTGIAGPQGGTPRKPVGTVWFGLSSLKGERALMRCFRGMDRENVREWTVAVALEMLWRELRRREACR